MNAILRVGNASGFYGDRFSAFAEMVEAGVDVITGDYLAELTMLILARQKAKDSARGFAKTFLSQLTGSLQAVSASQTRVVVNAGGMNPAGLAVAIRTAAQTAGIEISVAHVDGDDLTDRADELGLGAPLAANAYLGGFGITEALRAGARIVVTGRVTDAALTSGPAAWFHDWDREDYDRLAGAMAAGHVIECGMQATGGNFSFFTEIADLRRPGFPIAEIAADGSSVITKAAGTGGAVTAETVLSQLLYEVGGARYAGPDATLRLDTITVTDLGEDRVRLSGVRGEAPPPDLKVSITEIGGFRQEITAHLTGLDVEAKADLIRTQFAHALDLSGLPHPERMDWTLARTDHADANVQEEASAGLSLVARDDDPKRVGREFANLFVEFALGTIPGFFVSAPPGEASVYGRFRPGRVAQSVPAQRVHCEGRAPVTIAAPSDFLPLEPTRLDAHSPAAGTPGSQVSDSQVSGGQVPGGRVPDSRVSGGQTPGVTASGTPATGATGSEVTLPLGRLFGARSGDKGGTANIGLWARTEAAWQWLSNRLTSDALRALLPEFADCGLDRVELPNLRALNFVVHGALAEGVAYGARFDPQAKGVAEWLRSRSITVDAATAEATVLDDFFTAEAGPSSAGTRSLASEHT